MLTNLKEWRTLHGYKRYQISLLLKLLQGYKKSNSGLLFWQAALKFCSPWSTFVLISWQMTCPQAKNDYGAEQNHSWQSIENFTTGLIPRVSHLTAPCREQGELKPLQPKFQRLSTVCLVTGDNTRTDFFPLTCLQHFFYWSWLCSSWLANFTLYYPGSMRVFLVAKLQ